MTGISSFVKKKGPSSSVRSAQRQRNELTKDIRHELPIVAVCSHPFDGAEHHTTAKVSVNSRGPAFNTGARSVRIVHEDM